MNELVVFDEVAATLAEYKVENEKLVFDYADLKGEKDARSHIMKLRKVKTKISDVHKTAKAEALAFGKMLDGKKRELTGEVEKMIAVHKEPLDAIEAEKIAKAMEEVRKREEAETKRLTELEAREAAVRVAEEKALNEKMEAERIKREEREKAEQEIAMARTETERIEREKHIAEEAAARAKIEAEEAAERAKIQAQKQAKAEADARALAEKNRKEAEEAKEKKRIENKRHRKKIEDEINFALIELFDIENAEIILTELKANNIPHVSINY